MTKEKKTGQHPERPSWESFWDRPVRDGIDEFLRGRTDVVEPGRFATGFGKHVRPNRLGPPSYRKIKRHI